MQFVAMTRGIPSPSVVVSCVDWVASQSSAPLLAPGGGCGWLAVARVAAAARGPAIDTLAAKGSHHVVGFSCDFFL